jgi:hypothetical protein
MLENKSNEEKIILSFWHEQFHQIEEQMIQYWIKTAKKIKS